MVACQTPGPIEHRLAARLTLERSLPIVNVRESICQLGLIPWLSPGRQHNPPQRRGTSLRDNLSFFLLPQIGSTIITTRFAGRTCMVNELSKGFLTLAVGL